MNDFDKIRPHDIDAERSVLGSMMLPYATDQMTAELRGMVVKDDFFSPDHQVMCEAVFKVIDRSGAADFVTVREELTRMGKWDEVGGTSIIGEIVQLGFFQFQAIHYAKIVCEKSALRKMIQLGNDVALRSGLREASSEEIRGMIVNALADHQRSTGLPEAVVLEDAMRDVYEQAEGAGTPMLALQWDFLNDWLGGGVALGELIIIAGWPSHGKSALCKQFGEFLSMTGHAGGIVSVEESRHKIARNLLSAQSAIPNREIRSGKMTEQRLITLQNAIIELAPAKLYIQDRAQSLSQIVTSIELGVLKQKWEWAVIDHLDLVDIGDVSAENETTKHSTLSRTVKNTAKRLNIPIFAVKQLKKRGTSIRKPSPDDLRQSGGYHADADVILFVDSDDVHHREDTHWKKTGFTDLILSKAREGTGGIRELRWDGPTQRYQPKKEHAPNYDPFGSSEKP